MKIFPVGGRVGWGEGEGEGRTAKETFFVLVCHSGLAGGIGG